MNRIDELIKELADVNGEIDSLYRAAEGRAVAAGIVTVEEAAIVQQAEALRDNRWTLERDAGDDFGFLRAFDESRLPQNFLDVQAELAEAKIAEDRHKAGDNALRHIGARAFGPDPFNDRIKDLQPLQESVLRVLGLWRDKVPEGYTRRRELDARLARFTKAHAAMREQSDEHGVKRAAHVAEVLAKWDADHPDFEAVQKHEKRIEMRIAARRRGKLGPLADRVEDILEELTEELQGLGQSA